MPGAAAVAKAAWIQVTPVHDHKRLTVAPVKLNLCAGRHVLTARKLLGDGISTKIGAEFIHSTHDDMLAFAKRFNLTLNDLQASAERELAEGTWWFGNTLYTDQQVVAEFRPSPNPRPRRQGTPRWRAHPSRPYVACRVLRHNWLPGLSTLCTPIEAAAEKSIERELGA